MKASKVSGVERHMLLLNAAARVSRSVASILDLPLLLNRTVDIICEEFGFYYAGVFLVDEDDEWARLAAARGDAGRLMVDEGHKLHVGGNSMIGMAISKRQARIALDVGEEAVFFKNPRLPLTRSEMALPLIAGDQVIGALSVQSEVEAAFKQEDIAALQIMADQLAVAIQNAGLNRKNHDLLRHSERQARLLQAANTVGKEVTSIQQLDILLPAMVNTIVDAYGLYYAGIFLVDESGEWAVLSAGYGEAGKAMLAEDHRLQVGGQSMIGICIRLGEARIALDVEDERVHFKNPHLPYTRSEMALPLPFGGRVLGAVTIQSKEERAFGQDDITSLQTMADHLAVAIQNAYNMEALKTAHAELLRTKVYEALTVATTEAIHWIGNKALPISLTTARLKDELSAGPPDIESLTEDLELIGESANLIVQVKEQLIGQAREQKPRPVLLEDALQAAAHERGVRGLESRVTPEAAYVMADSTQLVRALGNLLRNATEAGASHIRAAAARKGGSVFLTLSDDGAGMSAAALEKAWTPFFSTRAGHNGLGLPAALHVISQLQGQIRIQSHPGQGTRVEIELPLAHPVAAEVGLSPRITLIDDDDAWARFFIRSVDTARRADKPALDAGLILIDEHLEALDFEATLEKIRQAGLESKTIVLTAALDVDRMTRLLREGFKDLRLKPYSPAEIAALWE